MPITDILSSGGVVEQIAVWGVLNQLLSGILAPFERSLANIVNSKDQQVPIDVADLARLVVRGYMTELAATSEAKKSGIPPDNFALLAKSAGNPPAPEALAEALRRGLIPEDSGDPETISFATGIREGDLQNKWAELVKQLAVAIPTPNDALDALLEGQIDETTALDLFKRFGGDPDYFTMLFDTRGTAPTPNEALVLANRGIIPWSGTGPDVVSFEQAFLEGPWRNKWLDPFRALGQYLPPPRTVTAMVKEGAITEAQALELWKKTGLSDELAAAYLKSAKSSKTQAHRELTLSLIEQLYNEQDISREQASEMIMGLGYSQTDIDFILQLQDLKRLQAAISHGLNTVHAQYINHHIDRAAALGAIDALGIVSQKRDALLDEWDTERKARVAILTPTQIRKAAGQKLIPVDEARERLINFGYAPADADIFMQL